MSLTITESPRDAIQGLPAYIPAEIKASYINQLLKVGFDIIDAGSFVSEKAIPQLKDTGEVLKKLRLENTETKIMVLVANAKGAEKAMTFPEINWIAFPYSLSPVFLKKNINCAPEESLIMVEQINNLCEINKKKLRVYLTMAFGNPYSDPYHTEMVAEQVSILSKVGIGHITLSDITGESNPKLISDVYELVKEFKEIEIGLHLHTSKNTAYEKTDAAYKAGCRSFDTVLSGMGGCPMTGYELLNNLDTIAFHNYCATNKISNKINKDMLDLAVKANRGIFSEFYSHQIKDKINN
ncbi:MAG: hypothetical protein A2275_03170 [Bacteroidetes bacterium RIFOXYA12_FULL_35_11]|nr:MAG: hypothetical protein A2X01_16555 [Bacteroidetes bacterium GWF2_35_48]OFY80743.1 MAG: hypothetical protein A2275_03170 [Bacteroidetes bacterium RIFOXYA12_FULL_35_11]OFY92720.1 MAG: hypothetical protein A2491_20945 [Bacteroidetes bacterium RIFOXYC12_FULL_35_7]OFY97120.1 MAG: hypothetical protein A2309_12055 [Bacteroidetes bacterium RIFOXYB2_FULL_35_7]HBX53426.1 hydroxymethylglutaryl-CoA lyase [Bacteroidales bacterium]